MSKITDYTVINSITEGSAEDLIRQISKLMLKGWAPFGSVAVSTEQGRVRLYQAMVRYEGAGTTPEPKPLAKFSPLLG